MSERMHSRQVPIGLKLVEVLLMVVGLFLLGIVLTPSVPDSQLVHDRVVDIMPVSAEALQPNASNPVNGTLASFTALIPDIVSIYIPNVSK